MNNREENVGGRLSEKSPPFIFIFPGRTAVLPYSFILILHVGRTNSLRLRRGGINQTRRQCVGHDVHQVIKGPGPLLVDGLDGYGLLIQ